MALYHINPDTGNPNVCRAQQDNCPFGWPDEHFESKAEARAAYEASNKSFKRPAKRGKPVLPLVEPGQPNPLLAEARVQHKKGWGGNDFKGQDGGRYLFLTVRGVNVAAVKIYEEDGPSLCDIETRPEYRHQGYAKELLKQVADLYGVERVSHTGGYTQAGFDFISKHLDRSGTREPAEVRFPEYDEETNPFSIIEDWDSQLTRWDG